MIRITEYPAVDVFAAMDAVGVSRLPDGRTFKKGSHRLVLFRTKGTECVTCGLNGTVFVLETHNLDIKPHLNLYAVKEDGDYVLMTKDHIIPKSKGGPDSLDNYNTMCMPCNSKKADKIS